MTDAPTTGHCHNENYMKTTHPFVAPVLGSTQSKVNMEAYEQAIDQYNEGNYLGAFYQLLDHLNPEFRTKYGNANGTEFHIPHGSILVHIRIADDRLHISADFLILPEKGRVAMLRQVADLNINRLMLPRFRKEDDRLMMEYACPLSQSHPHKLYFILRNICHVGDRYDDEFCTKFGAQRSYEPQVTPYPEEEVTRIYEAVRQTCRETLDAVKEYETERKYGYSWNVIDIALYKIAYFAHPQGQLLNDLDKAVDDMDKELPVAELVAKGKAFLERLLAMPREEMARDLYLVDTLVSTKRRSSLNNVQENFKEVYQEATEAIESENFERSTLQVLRNVLLQRRAGRPERRRGGGARQVGRENDGGGFGDPVRSTRKSHGGRPLGGRRGFRRRGAGHRRCGRRGAGAADGRRHAGRGRADAGRDAGGAGQRRHGRIHAAGAGIPAKNDGTSPRATKITALNPYILWNRTIFTRRYSK